MDASVVGVFIPISAILGGCAIGAISLWAGVRRREMIHRERLAMIERGIVPPAEAPDERRAPGGGPRPSRALRVGIGLIGLGLGVGTAVALDENLWTGVGIGCLLGFLGAAFVLNGLIEMRASRPAGPDAEPPPRTESHP